MPKVKISEYSATANSNTDVASINIDEGCAPSGINNAIRAVMGHLKDFQQGTYGDPFNGPVNGTLGATTASTANVTTLTTSSTVTHNGGTINGVAYLNGSKVLTTGSALVFNGTNFGVGVTPSAWFATSRVLQVGSGGAIEGRSNFEPYISTTSNAYLNTAGVYKYIATAEAGRYLQSSGVHSWYTAPSGTGGETPATVSFTQAMTLDANGRLGIGPTSPSTVLHTSSSIAGIFAQGTSTKTNNYLMTCSNSYNYGVVGVVSGDNTSGGDIYALGYVSSAGGSFNPVASWTSSGNLLVGKTASNLANAGIEIFGAGFGQFTASGDASLFTNRLGSDGDTIKFYRATTQVGSISVTATTTTLNPTSDSRLKENIADAGSALEKINSVRIRSFNWKVNNQFTDFGVIAQELNEVAPECVKVGSDEINEDGELKDPWCAQPYVLVPAMIKAIQEQQALITQLTARITALEGA
jgi:hypothetical protein